MARIRRIALSAARLPRLYHTVVGSTDNANSIACQRPNALEVAEQCPQTPAGRAVPEADGAIKSARHEIARWEGP